MPLAYKAALFKSSYIGQAKNETYTTWLDHEILQKLQKELNKKINGGPYSQIFFCFKILKVTVFFSLFGG